MRPSKKTVAFAALAALLVSAGVMSAAVPGLPEVPLAERTVVTNERIFNDEAPIPPQCYTKTDGRHNPCVTCHQNYDRSVEDRLNELDDGALQGEYSFSDVGETNHWTNLTVDRRAWLSQVGDKTIENYVNTDNYSSLDERLREQGFKGFIPDLEQYSLGPEAFDERGLARDGSFWVAFNYKPFPGTFWPTNGSTDDVVLRLPAEFRQLKGKFNRDVYYANLTLVELSIKNEPSAEIWPVDEKALRADLDGDGKFGTATLIRMSTHYVGDASAIELSFQQFPVGAEIMHSVRYVGVTDDERVFVPKRMKELRYMRKVNTLSRAVISGRYAGERKEKHRGMTPNYISRGDAGFDSGLGWFIQGFIEDYHGELRPQSYEEGMYCMGCHTAIGATIDGTFSFARKVAGAEGWGYIDLVGMKDAPSRGEEHGEILNYLARTGGGSEFRENPEMVERWYREDGSVDEAKVRAADVYTLITPSRRRALDLNKAYSHIVRHQSFIVGRDATWSPVKNVLSVVDESVAPLEARYRFFGWDLRLDWAAVHPSDI